MTTKGEESAMYLECMGEICQAALRWYFRYEIVTDYAGWSRLWASIYRRETGREVA